MDGKNFDDLTRKLATAASRRRVLRGLLGGAAALGGLKATDTLAAKETKVDLCHRTFSDSNPYVQITVAKPSTDLAPHLAHGDFLYVPGKTLCCGPKDCPGTDQCNIEACIYSDDTKDRSSHCSGVLTPRANGTPCDDGQYCTVNDVCTNGTCGGTARDCSALADACNIGACNETTDACEKRPAHEGDPCNDGQFCTTGDKCHAGACQPGTPTDCSSLDDDCNVGTCNETLDRCEKRAANEGGSCNDGQFCTSGETCTAGVCGGGTQTPCGACGLCDEEANTCKADPNANCGQCQACLINGDGTYSCQADTLQNGQSCNDGAFCTTGEKCDAGVCGGGTPTDCGLCGLCDEDEDTCYADPDATCDQCKSCQVNSNGAYICQADSGQDGDPCDDGVFCNVGETCLAGTCQGGTDRDCGLCGLCDEATDACIADPDAECDQCEACLVTQSGTYDCQINPGQTCDDGNACTTGDTCDANGACIGTPVSCTGCGQCDASTGLCAGTGSCDDGDLCTTDACVADAATPGQFICQYTPVSCITPPNTVCYQPTGTCVSGDGSCNYTALGYGTACGTCLICDGNGSCVADPACACVEDGSECDPNRACCGVCCNGTCAAADSECGVCLSTCDKDCCCYHPDNGNYDCASQTGCDNGKGHYCIN